MSAVCAYPGCDKPPRPVPRARYCSWEHLTDAQNRREREQRRRKRAAAKAAGAQRRPMPRALAEPAAPMPTMTFVDDPRAARDPGSRGPLPAPMSWALGASSLVVI